MYQEEGVVKNVPGGGCGKECTRRRVWYRMYQEEGVVKNVPGGGCGKGCTRRRVC